METYAIVYGTGHVRIMDFVSWQAAKAWAESETNIGCAAIARPVDGARYWLGATWATYKADGDVFLGGNWFVDRCDTIYR